MSSGRAGTALIFAKRTKPKAEAKNEPQTPRQIWLNMTNQSFFWVREKYE